MSQDGSGEKDVIINPMFTIGLNGEGELKVALHGITPEMAIIAMEKVKSAIIDAVRFGVPNKVVAARGPLPKLVTH